MISPECALFCVCAFFFGTVCGFTTDYLCIYIPRMYFYAYMALLPLLLLINAAALCCCIIANSLAAAPAVRHHVPDGKICCWSVESNSSSVFFLFIPTRFVFNVLLGSTAVASTALICLSICILRKHEHARCQGALVCV